MLFAYASFLPPFFPRRCVLAYFGGNPRQIPCLCADLNAALGENALFSYVCFVVFLIPLQNNVITLSEIFFEFCKDFDEKKAVDG